MSLLSPSTMHVPDQRQMHGHRSQQDVMATAKMMEIEAHLNLNRSRWENFAGISGQSQPRSENNIASWITSKLC